MLKALSLDNYTSCPSIASSGNRRTARVVVQRESLQQRATEAGEVLMRYTGCKAGTITVPGPVSGKGYQVSKFRPVVPVLGEDIADLQAMGVLVRYEG